MRFQTTLITATLYAAIDSAQSFSVDWQGPKANTYELSGKFNVDTGAQKLEVTSQLKFYETNITPGYVYQ